jgi:hypothetical protein
MKAALGCWLGLLVLHCGYHDTAVAVYQPPIAVGTGGGGASAEAGQSPGTSEGGQSMEASAGAGAESGAAPGPRCQQTYTTTVDGLSSRYKLVAPGQPWVVAERDCEADGAHLVVIDDAAEQTYLTSLAAATTTDNGSTNQLLWLGLTDQASEGSFAWVTGASVSLTHWSDGEPNNSFGGIEDCAEIRGSGDWNDDHCSARLGYVCECDGAASLELWCDTDLPATCGDCRTSCSEAQACVTQKCE